ncbi:hypothetical protein COB11_07605 [Candidatus Aerophobetes bacterium]|uniref:Leucine-rich repeat domain-containing protein n=1 Tax=Aerophobetes bacterium TaxID=2030807 RepID=A0A2A4YBP4_UNCAE|nr:MAG: hypothetical protein COB11_07605 [Candidatus Aerophobetes bacterium]
MLRGWIFYKRKKVLILDKLHRNQHSLNDDTFRVLLNTYENLEELTIQNQNITGTGFNDPKSPARTFKIEKLDLTGNVITVAGLRTIIRVCPSLVTFTFHYDTKGAVSVLKEVEKIRKFTDVTLIIPS